MTHMESVTVPCPRCRSASHLALFEATDNDGVVTRQEFEFVCPKAHYEPEEVLIDLWARARATMGMDS